jgi:hypothetical protein
MEPSLDRSRVGKILTHAQSVSGGQAASTTERGDGGSGKRVMQRAPAE